MSITCPRCNKTNNADSINCSQCGFYFVTHPLHVDEQTRSTFLVPPRILSIDDGLEIGAEKTTQSPTIDREKIRFQLIIGQEKIIHLNGDREYHIGRADIQSDWEPTVDLTAYGGEPGGVSRRHARIFVEDGQPYIEDLGSLNGTYINTVRLITRVPQPLHDGDQLLFGRMLIEMRINPVS